MYKSDFSLADRISIVSDEISEDFTEASFFANKFHIKNFELRKFIEGRIPEISVSTLRELLDKKNHFNYTYTLISPGFFKHCVSDKNKTNHQINRIHECIDLAKILEVKFISVFTFKRNFRNSKIPKEIYATLCKLKDLC